MVTAGMAEPDVEEYDPMIWFIFIGCTLFNLILMLNLLIAIISSSYDTVM